MQLVYTIDEIERFWKKVDKECSLIFYNDERCREWLAGCDSSGYGEIKIRGKVQGAHRMSYRLSFGDIPDGMDVLHHCDNPACVNPAHIFSGTHQDNVDDKVKKGRQAYGENSRHKLSNEQITEIRKRYSFWGIDGDDTVTLAKEFGVSKQHISNIIKFRNRKNVA